MHEFDGALSLYREARTWCDEHGMPVLVAAADYNIAYLHFLRGQYTVALDLYRSARSYCERAGDDYHSALCDLDQAEVYLELNLADEGAELAESAATAFSKLGMGYERVKALTFHAVAMHRRGESTEALKLFGLAHRLFRQEHNPIWPATIDVYRALVLIETGRARLARRFVENASKFFAGTPLSNRIGLCELLSARLDAIGGQYDEARRRCRLALNRITDESYPAVQFQGEVILGQVEEAADRSKDALSAYRRAQQWIEVLRSNLVDEGLKISFLSDKLSVYEALVRLTCKGPISGEASREVFGWIENAKSRALEDMLGFSGRDNSGADSSELTAAIVKLRQQLAGCYGDIEAAWDRPEPDVHHRVGRLWQAARQCERDLLRRLADTRSSAAIAAAEIRTAEPAAIQASIPAGATLVEYYQANGTIYVCVVDRSRCLIQPICATQAVEEELRLLRFQLSRFRLGDDYVQRFGAAIHRVAAAHLRRLFDFLIRPIRAELTGSHLILVPHAALHHLPFHALLDGDRSLLDDFTLSYAPSASIYQQCSARVSEHDGTSLVIGAPDHSAPYIEMECESVARLLPSTIRLQCNFEFENIERCARRSRFIHVAAHGVHRHDNPMFSALRLGDHRLSAFDLGSLKLSAELVTLSGCSTGLHVVVGGDELMGLVRLPAQRRRTRGDGLSVGCERPHHVRLYGTLLSYLANGRNSAEALREAMLETRRRHPHPYYWAPFVIIGRYCA